MKNTGTGSGLIASILNKLNLSAGESFNAIITEGQTTPGYIAETTLITNPNSWGTQGYVTQKNLILNNLINLLIWQLLRL